MIPVVRLSSSVADIADRYDVVVVGSGYGGAIAACRLATAGRTVCVLERGREIRPGEYPNTGLKLLGDFQLDLPGRHLFSSTALFDFRLNKEINVLVGCGLGGTSLINANVTLRPEDWVFEHEDWPVAFRSDLTPLQRGFERAEHMLQPIAYGSPAQPVLKPIAHPPPAQPDLPRLLKQDALEKMAAHIRPKRPFERPLITVSFDAGRNKPGLDHPACQLCGDCVTGCNYGAKNTVLMNYLPDAHRHGAKIFTEVPVHSVEPADGEWIVRFGLANGNASRIPLLSVRAKIVILAAGTLGSTEILLRSRGDRLCLSKQLGQRFTGNADVVALAYNGTTPIDGVGAGARRPDLHEPVGPCITGLLDFRGGSDRPEEREKEMVIEEGSIPGALGVVIPAIARMAALFWGRPTAATRAPSIPEQLGRWFRFFSGAYHGAMRRTLTLLVMGHDNAGGRMELEDGRVRIRWPGAADQPIFDIVHERLRQASGALGATYIRNPFNLTTVHPLGGCRMGDNGANGVVDHEGRVFIGDGSEVHEGLYVCDGSVIPRSLGANPLLTISALAERTSELLLRRYS